MADLQAALEELCETLERSRPGRSCTLHRSSVGACPWWRLFRPKSDASHDAVDFLACDIRTVEGARVVRQFLHGCAAPFQVLGARADLTVMFILTAEDPEVTSLHEAIMSGLGLVRVEDWRRSG